MGLACMGTLSVSAQTAEKAPAENYELSVGHLSMCIDAANGARITSFKYDGQEVLSQVDQPNMYGSTFWTSPQKDWNWPPVKEHDLMKYSVEKQGDKLIMTSQVPANFPLRVTKEFATDAQEECMVVTYSIRNEGMSAVKVAPWEITRVPAEGLISFEANAEEVWPKGVMNFQQKENLACYEIDQADQNRKVNANGTGWLRYEHDGLVLTKRFMDLKPGEPAPGEDEIQVYVHNGKVYVELESQGKYTRLHPAASLQWTVKWYLNKP